MLNIHFQAAIIMIMDNNNNEPVDLTARLDESDLLKPGSVIAPNSPTKNQIAGNNSPAAAKEPHDLNRDVVEFNDFAESQTRTHQETEVEPKKGILHVAWELLKTLLIAAAVVIFINTFVFQAYYVSGSSMNPGYNDGDYILINKLASSLNNVSAIWGNKKGMDIKRGDVLVFRPPENAELFYVKRVIALPGERITLKNGVFKIYNKESPNGFILKEPYIDPAYISEGEVDEIIAPGNVFTVGDNRSPGGSYDSRFWGQLPQKNISGNAFFRLLPLNDIGFLGPAEYK